MEDLNLTETEMRYFGDLFLCCDEESNGKIPILKATELFRSSNIPNDVLKQIMDISVAPSTCASLNHMNRKQFYSALKLIAAHQTNRTLKPELLATPLDLPLPRFTWALNSDANADLIQLSNSPKEQHIPKRERNFVGSIGAYEPMRVSANLSDSDVPQTLSHDNTEAHSTDSEIESETTSQRSGSCGRRAKAGSPWSTASESPTPTNSVAEKVHPVWEHSATGRGVWPVNTAEEHTQLLGTEEESSDRHSSDEDGEAEGASDDVFVISEAQAQHYAAQFAQLRPERGLLSGHTARLFFEKSRLSVPDLRKIWQLADMDKDGMLSLEEFSIAMHLIVLRRANVPVPAALPPRLLPPRPPPADLVHLAPDMFGSGSSADFDFQPVPEPEPPARPADASLTPPKEAAKEWTKFVDSPTFGAASPRPEPVNFDFKAALERDPKIFHPVALRATPDGGRDERAGASPRRDDLALAFEPAPRRPQPEPAPAPAVQRPQPRKPPKSAGALPPPPARDEQPQSLQHAPRKEPPPPPPPRPLRNHTRSSSLDLNRLKSAPPPQPPPRMSPREYDGEGFGYAREDGPRMQGAFEVYRKRSPASAADEPDVRALHEQNAVLHRVCRALCAELADAQRERRALAVRLDPRHDSRPDAV
ncbi:ralBP1-associated Eps domain-containing protein 1 [Aricia agestis]|uniref:ralBP1-associated Eps domain-containing protein 1 n=1 Tax=Aricia agestis TaxID=91739 RepID=UPI001C207A57|nr:ralBP1-associated Eps domain-containing protein 1 [Aricia agestis]